MRQPANSNDNSLRCSFCGKSQEKVGKLISSPSNFPRAYICDQCVAVCEVIIEDDKGEPEILPAKDAHEGAPPHRLLAHPLASDLMDAIERWMREQSVGNDGMVALAEVRRVARLLLSELQDKHSEIDN